VAAPILAELAGQWLLARHPPRQFVNGRPAVSSDGTNAVRGFNDFVIAAMVVFAAARMDSVVRRQPALEAEAFPEAAVAFIAQHHPAAPVFNSYNWGGYLIWKLYPQYRVFIDGRADVYGDPLMRDFAHAYYLTQDWQDSLEKWQIQTVIVPPDAPLAVALGLKEGWRPIYQDRQAVILERSPR
jgi:hypothetical protein